MNACTNVLAAFAVSDEMAGRSCLELRQSEI